MIPERGKAPKASPAGLPCRIIAERLIVPIDAELHPPLTDTELHALFPLLITFFHPTLGPSGFDESATMRVAELLDLPEERAPLWPATTSYFDRRYGKSGWTSSVVLNLAIGQGENAQTILNMARFYTALATDGTEARPEVVKRAPERKRLFKLTDKQFTELRAALANVVETGTAARAKIEGVVLAGKTGTAQSRKYGANGKELNFSWFVGFAPADDPKIVVAMMLEYVPFQGATTATLVSKIIGSYLHVTPKVDIVPY